MQHFRLSNLTRSLRYVLGPAFVAIIFSLCAATAHAQFRASIQGTVTDSTGAVIPGATLTLTDTDTNHAITAISNGSGVYNFNALAPDHYTLTVERKGLPDNRSSGCAYHSRATQLSQCHLADSATASTSVTVSGDALPALETETASISGTVDSNQIQHLPSSGRDVFQLVQLAPGVFGDGSQSSNSSNGNQLPGTARSRRQPAAPPASSKRRTAHKPTPTAASTSTNGINIDGISTVSAVWGGTSVITPTEDSVGSVKSSQTDTTRRTAASAARKSKSPQRPVATSSMAASSSEPAVPASTPISATTARAHSTPAPRPSVVSCEIASARIRFGGSIGGPI